MDYDDFVSGLPSDRTLVCSSAEEIEERLAGLGVNQRTRQLGKGEFKSAVAASVLPSPLRATAMPKRSLACVFEAFT